MDEPTSSISKKESEELLERINRLKAKGITIIYISHRLSSALLSDKIFVFENGTVTESGTHKELMEKGGAYCNMFTLQAKSFKNEKEEGDINEA